LSGAGFVGSGTVYFAGRKEIRLGLIYNFLFLASTGLSIANIDLFGKLMFTPFSYKLAEIYITFINLNYKRLMTENKLRELFYNHEGNLIHKWDHYFDIYEKYFARYIGKEINILEIGISHGGSLQLWKKYFGIKANIYAIDINPQCKMFEEEKVKIFIGSQEDELFLQKVLQELPDMDIIIDDGGHTMNQQIISFENLYLKVKEGGVYLVEDTHTSYWDNFHGGLKKKNTFIEYSKNFIDSLYEGHISEKKRLQINEITKHILSISFYDSIVVFEKKKRPDPFHIRKGTETIESYNPTEHKKPSLLKKIKNLFFEKSDTFKLNDRGKL
jgi:23S rRNA U2552 (ribose-2'-O)-methylase RlmE/FtsJ